ncbi:TetR/AcrR family transcriptional regulator [Mangrovactinospora gilvigrisea]|nr:TetR family transcriptional regulator [Mangrovactinospora gilvigrisea]
MRQHISAVATRLFQERGFEAVTVAEIAEAADVSKMTVFNYFPRKEDLYLDRTPQLRELLLAAVRERAAGEAPVAALRRAVAGLAADGHPLIGAVPGIQTFLQVVRDSPALAARWREVDEQIVTALAAELAAADGRAEASLRDEYTAAAVLRIRNLVLEEAVRRIASGTEAAVARAELAAVAEELFALLERGVRE